MADLFKSIIDGTGGKPKVLKDQNVFSGKTIRPSWDKTNRSFTFQLKTGTSSSDNGFGNIQVVTLIINPEEFTQIEPPRINIQQTKGGAVVTHFGEGLKQVTLRGTTGFWKKKMQENQASFGSGVEHFQVLRKLIRTYWQGCKENPKDYVLEFYNWATDEAYEVVPTQFSLLRSVSRPLLFQYNIGLTCLRDLGIKFSGDVDVFSNKDYKSGSERKSTLIRDKIQFEVNWLDSIIKNVTDITKYLSTDSKTWGSNIAKGYEYYDTLTSTYKTVEEIIIETKSLALDIDSYVKGATTFITKPFELVKNLIVSIGDICVALISVTNVPHEIVRSFRELQCALRQLTEKSFRGFTNPSLFEGVSNCGSSYDIPMAAVSSYENSFSATAASSSITSISDTFSSPTKTVMLKTSPLRVRGVYLDTDISRTGLNYLESYSGNIVTLTSVPTTTIIVDYDIKNPQESDLMNLESSVSKIIKGGDTLARISYKAYGDPSKWKEIAVFNNLEYPFIIDDPDFEKEIQAKGTIRFYRDTSVITDITIESGHLLYVPYRIVIGTEQIDFTVDVNPLTTDGSYTMAVGVNVLDVPITAVKTGEIGNIGPSQISGPYGDTNWSNETSVFQSTYNKITGIRKVSNLSGTLGGKVWRIMSFGDLIQIPKESSDMSSGITGAKQDYEELFGTDIYINKYGELEDAIDTGRDIRSISGVKNLVQALTNRINTTKGFYVFHDTYGTNLPIYVGKKNIQYWDDLLKFDIIGSCLMDNRIDSINSINMTIDGDTISLDFDAIPINEKTSLPINVIV